MVRTIIDSANAFDKYPMVRRLGRRGEFNSAFLRMLEMSGHSRSGIDASDEWAATDDNKFFANTSEIDDLQNHRYQTLGSNEFPRPAPKVTCSTATNPRISVYECYYGSLIGMQSIFSAKSECRETSEMIRLIHNLKFPEATRQTNQINHFSPTCPPAGKIFNGWGKEYTVSTLRTPLSTLCHFDKQCYPPWVFFISPPQLSTIDASEVYS